MRYNFFVIFSFFVIAPDKGFFDISICDVDLASCDSIVGSIDFTIVCSEGDVFLCRELCSLASDDGIVITICSIFIPS